MKKILLFSLSAIFLISCANEQATPTYDDVAPRILAASGDNSIWNQDNNTYTKNVSLRVHQPEEYPVSITLCFLQNPTGTVIDKVGKVTASEYERMGFQTQGCTSLTYSFPDDTNKDFQFNVLEAIKDLEGNQYIYGETYVSLMLEGDFEQIYLLGKENIVKPDPEVSPKYGFHSSTVIDNESTWSIINAKHPEFITATAEIDLTIKGETADVIKIYAGNISGSATGTAQVMGLDGQSKGSISYTLESTILEPTQIKADISDNYENVLSSVDFANHSTTDANVLPDVTAMIKINIPYKDIEPFLQKVADNKTYLIPSDIYTNEIPASFMIVAEKDGVEYTSDNSTVTIDFGSLIYDVRDYYESIFASEYLNGHEHAESTSSQVQSFSPLKYEAPKDFSSGNSQFKIRGNVKAGLYVEEVAKDDTTKVQQMRSRVETYGYLTLIGTEMNAFEGYVEAIGVPNSTVESNDGSATFEVDLSIFGKKVLNNKVISAPTNFSMSYDKLTFEKDFEQSNTITLVVPFYYKIGGRGAVGFVPSVNIAYTKGSFDNTADITEVSTITNPTQRPAQTLVEADVIPNISRFSHEYSYNELPQWAKTFVDSNGIEKNGDIVNDYNNKLLIEYQKRVRHNSAIYDYKEDIPALVTTTQTITEQPLGIGIKFQGTPYANISGYGEGGFGVAKDWKLAKFGLGIGVEANLDPILDISAPVTLGGFIGIGNSPVDKNNYIYLNYNFQAPFYYSLLKGKAWVGLSINFYIKIFKWIKIIDDKFGPTLFDTTGQKPSEINLIQPVNNNHMILIKGNTP